MCGRNLSPLLSVVHTSECVVCVKVQSTPPAPCSPLGVLQREADLPFLLGPFGGPSYGATDRLPLYIVVVCAYVSSSAVLYEGKIRVQLIFAPPCHSAPALRVHFC